MFSRLDRADTGVLTGAQVRGWWYDPRDGSAREVGTNPNRGVREFVPPGTPRARNDWVLALDDTSSSVEAPGNPR